MRFHVIGSYTGKYFKEIKDLSLHGFRKCQIEIDGTLPSGAMVVHHRSCLFSPSLNSLLYVYVMITISRVSICSYHLQGLKLVTRSILTKPSNQKYIYGLPSHFFCLSHHVIILISSLNLN